MSNFTAAGDTRKCSRDENQDTYLIHRTAHFFAVFDGMGGHAHGRRAAEVACQTMEACLEIGVVSLFEAARAANDKVLDIHPDGRRMDMRGRPGTTMVGLDLQRKQIIWCGDSKAYRLRDGGLELLHVPHSMVHMHNAANPEYQLDPHNAYNPIMRHVGGLGTVGQAEVIDIDIQPGDRFMLCSDGLDPLDPADVLEVLLTRNPSAAAMTLTAMAESDPDCTDNTTVVVVDVN